MKIIVVVDANPIIAALIGGVSKDVLFDHRFNFATAEFTLNEVKKYLPVISKKSGVREERIRLALSFLPLTVYAKREYAACLKEADELIGKTDKKDVDALALALFLKVPLWTEDKDFETVKDVTVVKTKDLL